MRERLFAFLLAITISILGIAGPSARADQTDATDATMVDVAKPGLYLVPNDVIEFELNAAKRIDGFEVEEVHNYGPSRLLFMHDLSGLSAQTLSRMTALDDTSVVMYGPWIGTADVRNPGQGETGYFIVSLSAPAPVEWVDGLASRGLKVVDTAWPYGFVVHGNATALEDAASSKMTNGSDLVRGIQPVPFESRIEPELYQVALANKRVDEIAGVRKSGDGRFVVRVIGFSDQSERRIVRQTSRYADPAGDAGYGYPDAFLVNGPEVVEILENVPGVQWIELVHERRKMDNLAAKAGVLDIEQMWTAGWNGAGVRVNHNDGGIDVNGVGGVTAFPGTVGTDGSVISALAGNHTNSDTAHGTHTAGSVAGRALSVVAPTSTSGCGDLIAKNNDARGMAWGATLNSNNLFDPGTTGKTTEDAMMKWAQDNGSHLSTNSWGYISTYTYGSQAVTIDRAVRDADTTEAGNQALTILFAAGNDGSGAGTVGNPGTGKNAITVGASHNVRCGSYPAPGTLNGNLNTMVDFSGRGPSQGRIKPDIVATGANVLSVASDDPGTFGNNPDSHGWDQTWTGPNYELMPGTSMACPIAAGAAADFFQFFQATFGAYPSPALAKAALINGAVGMTGYTYENTATGTYAQGWGRLNLRNSIQGPSGGSIRFREQSTADAVTTGTTRTYTFSVSSSSTPLKLSLVWTDPPGASGSSAPLRNNLDLVVTAPNGTVYRGNRFTGVWSIANPGTGTDTANNVENVFVQSPATGTWTVQVVGTNVTTNVTGITGQDFAIAHSGAVTDLTTGGGCSYSISPTSASPSASATTGSVSVTAGTGCAWTAVSNATSWLTVTSGASGSGNGSVGYSVAANTGAARNGTITIAGQTFTVNQAAGASCSYSISPTSASAAAAGTTGSVSVTAGTGCAWSATSNAAWLTITSGASGSGNGTTNYSVAANTGAARNGTLTVAGQTFTVNQAAGTTGATPIPCGTSPSGALATSDGRSTVRGATFYADVYSFTPSASGTATITMNSTAFDTYLILKSSAGATTALAQDDDGNGGTNSKITYTVTAGTTYYLDATSYSANATGAYTIGLTCPVVATELVTNGGFDTGAFTPWVAATNSTLTTTSPFAGTHCARMLGVGSTASTNFYQPISGFNGATKTLRFNLKMTSAESTTTAYDFLYVRLKNTAGTTVSTMATYDNRQKNTYAGWVQITLTVPATALTNYRISFDATEDSSLQTTFFIDSVSIQ